MYDALTVNLLIGGTATPGTDYTLTDAETWQPVSGSVTIPAGEYSANVIVTPIDDLTPEWTETVTAALAPGDPPAFRVGQASATEEITDNDLDLSVQGATTGPDGNPVINLNNDDDDGDGTADLEQSSASGGDDDLAPLSVDYPQDIKYGATVTLSGDTSKLKVWADASKSQLIIGGDQTSHTWIVGQDTIPSQMVVEGVTGSEELADATLTVQDSDSSAAPRPTRPTGNQRTQRESVRFIRIFWTDPLHPNDGFRDRAGIGVNDGAALQVLVGQGITLTAQAGPPQLFPQNQQSWDVPGNNVGGYTPGANQAQPAPTQTTNPIVSFYWVDGGNRRVVTYTTNGWQQRVAFDVVRPTAHVATNTPQLPSVTQQLNPDGSTSAWVKFDSGITFTNQNPQIPNGFGGTFFWVQLIEPHDTYWTTADGIAHNYMSESAVLDTQYPYSNNQPGTGDGPMAINIINTWVNHVSMDDDFTMYLMFTPTLPNGQAFPGGAIPVPIRMVDWWWTGEVQWNGQQWVGSHLDASMNPADINTTILPTWDQNVTALTWNPPLPPRPPALGP